MADETKLVATINATALHNGHVTLKLSGNGNNIVVDLAPDELSGLVRVILSAAHGASFVSGKKPVLRATTTAELIPTTFIGLANLPAQGQHAILIQTGESVVAYSVTTNGLRELSMAMKGASWDHQSTGALRELFARCFADFGSDLRRLGGEISARLKALSRRRAMSLSVWLSGRSLRVFRTIKIALDSPPLRFAAVGRCIYCGNTVYSTRAGDRKSPLGLEHIIAEGLGGNVELPEASCKECEHATGAVTENDVLGRTLKALRVHLKLKKKGSGPHPQTLALDATVDGKERRIDLPISDYPIVFMMILYPPPKFVADATSAGKIALGAAAAVVQYDATMLFAKYKITGAATAYWDNLMLCRMLAKIGHSLAAAELNRDAFAGALTDLIRFGSVASMNMIGGAPAYAANRPSNALHELGLGYQRPNGKNYVVATVRLFANRGGPTYYVVVGESLESSIARFRRVFSSKISSMLAL